MTYYEIVDLALKLIACLIGILIARYLNILCNLTWERYKKDLFQ